MSNSAPCRNCSERYVGCHDECVKYLDFKQEIEIQNQRRREELSLHDYNEPRRKQFRTKRHKRA